MNTNDFEIPNSNDISDRQNERVFQERDNNERNSVDPVFMNQRIMNILNKKSLMKNMIIPMAGLPTNIFKKNSVFLFKKAILQNEPKNKDMSFTLPDI